MNGLSSIIQQNTDEIAERKRLAEKWEDEKQAARDLILDDKPLDYVEEQSDGAHVLTDDVDAQLYTGDIVNKIIMYENGMLDDDETIEFFQQLIDSGLAWTLQGSYGRAARALIESGRCHEKR